MKFPFKEGHPVHVPLQQGIEYRTLGDFTERNGFTVDTEVGLIREPQRPASVSETASARDCLCLHVPTFGDTAARDEFGARNLKPIGKDDVALFTDLLCRMFDYNPQTRITARQVLEHPWLKETSQESPNDGSAAHQFKPGCSAQTRPQ
jgi:serine/threonine protein kinase